MQSAGGVCRPDRSESQGRRQGYPRRPLPLQRQRQGHRARRGPGFRQDHLRQEDRAASRRTHGRRRGDRAHPGFCRGDEPGDDRGRVDAHDLPASDAVGDDEGERARRLWPRFERMISHQSVIDSRSVLDWSGETHTRQPEKADSKAVRIRMHFHLIEEELAHAYEWRRLDHGHYRRRSGRLVRRDGHEEQHRHLHEHHHGHRRRGGAERDPAGSEHPVLRRRLGSLSDHRFHRRLPADLRGAACSALNACRYAERAVAACAGAAFFFAAKSLR
ncbi:hypothetical protein MPLDJ20_140131 [Mesorhizobium plurifarium]|uniref:Uncharacterized protein n=1 Tax=Mesorhizobium plurifarium TaxID=69974 RepID=A0A090EPT0_MESPL|nr:hypothetical protein MPLDJ20_140131 [Mesorhizobium plurifarium]CDX57551.1 hypothetical protein MPL3365_270114 [Mesorhizobium plurifarium]